MQYDRPGQARKALEEALKLDDSNVQAHMLMGLLRSDKADFEGALASFQTACRLDPAHVVARIQAAEMQLALDDPTAAEALLAEALVIGPDDPDAVTAMAMFRLEQQDYDAAEPYCRRLTALDPTNERGWLGLGDICRERNEWEAALAHYKRAAELAPEAPEPHGALGSVYGHLGDPLAMQHELELALKLGGDDLDVLVRVAEHFSEGERHDRALDCLLQALAEEPDDVDLLYRAARECLLLERATDARDLLKRALAQEPLDFWCNYLWVVLLGQDGGKAAAAAYLETLARQDAEVAEGIIELLAQQVPTPD